MDSSRLGMLNGVDSATVSYMDRSTVKVRFINDPEKLTKFTSGFFVGKIGRLAVIFTIGHFVNRMPNIEYSDEDELEVVCYGSDEAYPCRVEMLIKESEILVLSCYTNTEIEHFYNFAPKEEWEEDLKGQKILCTSHPSRLEWRVYESIVGSSQYLNGKTVSSYDPNLIFFDHYMSMGVGSSGAGILNMNKNVVGMQSGEFLLKQEFISEWPWKNVFDSIKTGNEVKDLSLAISGAKLRIKPHDIQEVSTRPSNLNYAIHIAYLDEVLRKSLSYLIGSDNETISLNDLILRYVYHNNHLYEWSGY